MVSPKSLANLRPFKKGENGHQTKPEGAISLTGLLRKHLAANPGLAQELIEAWCRQAKTNPAVMREIWERIDGKVAQPEEHTGKIVLEVKFDRNELDNATKQG